VALVQLRHFIVSADLDQHSHELALHFRFQSRHSVDVDLAALLEANMMAERDVDRELRYRVLQYELRMILSYLSDDGSEGQLRLDVENFAATAGHIKRFVSESVGLGMLTAAVQEFFAWEFGPNAIANFDVLSGELKDIFGIGGIRPDLLFDFRDGARVLAGEARGRSEVGPHGTLTRAEQRQRMREILQWSGDHGGYPVTMTWTYLGGSGVQVDLFTVSDESMGSLGYVLPCGPEAGINVGARQQYTADAVLRSERRAARIFDTAPAAPFQKPRRLFGTEVRGDWVTADLLRPSNVRLFLGALDRRIPVAVLRETRSRSRQAGRRLSPDYATALSDQLLIVVARSENPEPEWSHVEALIERGESSI
jgi:hypothetical protein